MKFFFLFVILVSFWFKIYHIEDRSLTWDEMETFLEANGIGYKVSFRPYAGFTSGDFQKERKFKNSVQALISRDSGNGIVYISMLYVWMKSWGNSSATIRSLSLLFSMLTVFMVYLLAMELFKDRNTSFWCASVFCFHELAVQYSTEARAYSVAAFFCVVTVWLFFKLVNGSQSKNYLLIFFFALSTSMALLSHYFSSFIIIALIVIALLYLRNVNAWKNLIASSIFVFIVVLLWLFTGGLEGLDVMHLRNEDYRQLSLADPENSFYGRTTLSSAVGGFLQMVTHTFGIGFQKMGMEVRYSCLFLILPGLLFFLNKKEIVKNKNEVVSLIILSLIIPLIAVFLAYSSGHIISFQTLYLNFSVPFSCILIGFLVSISIKAGNKKTVIPALLFYLVLFLSNYPNLFLKEEQKQGMQYELEARRMEAPLLSDTIKFNSLLNAYYLNLFFTRKDIIQKVDSLTVSKSKPNHF